MFLLDYTYQGDNSVDMPIIITKIMVGVVIIGVVIFIYLFAKEAKIQREIERKEIEEANRQEAEMFEKIIGLSNRSSTITPDEFFRIKARAPQSDFTGVYILYNNDKGMYYVGQGKSVYKRVNAHFTGHGNGDVYADYKYGDRFTIKMVSLASSGFNTLDELERKMIAAYGAYSRGYNKTRGNSGYSPDRY